MSKDEKALATLDSFASLAMPRDDMKELLEDMGMTAGGDRFSLPRLTLPSQGSLFWDFKDGTQPVKAFDGIILAKKDIKTYWIDSNATGQAPDCASEDGVTGLGRVKEGQKSSVNRPCATCPHNQWGSDPKGGRGKACKDKAIVAILTKDGILPIILTVPPTSLRVLQDYTRAVVNRNRLPVCMFITEFALKEAQGGSAKYAQLDLRMKEILPAEAHSGVRTMRDNAREMLAATRVREMDNPPDMYMETEPPFEDVFDEMP